MRPGAALNWPGVTAFLLLAFAASPAQAKDIHLRYAAYWGGLHVADFALSMADLSAPTPDKTENVFRLATRGLTGWALRLNLTARTDAAVNDAAPFLTPQGYLLDYTSRRRDRVLKIDFSPPRARTAIIDRKDDGKEIDPTSDDDDYAEADIAPAQLENVIDPLLGLTEALRRTRATLEGIGPRTFRLRGFDGKRRFDMNGEVLGPATRTIARTRHDVYRLRLTTVPVAGFKERHRLLWDDSAFDLYLSRDGRFVPLQIVSLGQGPVLTLEEECAQACELTEK